MLFKIFLDESNHKSSKVCIDKGSGFSNSFMKSWLRDNDIKMYSVHVCVIDIYSKHMWVAPLKDRKGITIINAFQKILDESNRKPSKRGR